MTRAAFTLLATALLLGSSPASAAPTAAFSPHRGGNPAGADPAPTYVWFDARQTRSSDASDNAATDLLYHWDFGDPAPGDRSVRWSTTQAPKNMAYGVVAAHVYEKPGVYTVTLTVRDKNGAMDQVQRTVTIDAPAQVWSAGQTECISASGSFSGCPAGAKRTTSADFDATVGAAIGAGKRRILLRAGETYFADSRTVLGRSPETTETGIVGTFGPAGQATVKLQPGLSGGRFVLEALGWDWRIVDLNIDGTNGGDNGGGISHNDAGRADYDRDILMLRVTVLHTDGQPLHFGANALPQRHTYIAWVDCLSGDSGNANKGAGQEGSKALGLVGASRSAVLGCRLRNPGNNGQSPTHIARVHAFDNGVISHNVFTQAAGAYEALKLHCSENLPPGEGGSASGAGVGQCYNNVVSDNQILSGWVRLGAGGHSNEARSFLDSTAFERNYVNSLVQVNTRRTVIRYNVIRGNYPLYIISVRNLPGLIENRIHNNVLHRTGGGKIVGVLIEDPNPNYGDAPTNASNTEVHNNILFAPNAGSFQMLEVSGSSASHPQSVQANLTTRSNPFVASTFNDALDYRPKPGSSPIDGGTSSGWLAVDLAGGLVPLGPTDIGAFEAGSPSADDGSPPPPGVDLVPPAAPVLLDGS